MAGTGGGARRGGLRRLTAAAGRVHVTQQVLSAQVRQLEDAVGTPLLARTSRGVALTAAGAAFLDVAREMLALLDRGVAAARHAAQAVSGRLVVGLSAATGGLSIAASCDDRT